MIVLVGGEKGGTGKTTLSTNLAAMRNNETDDLLLIDTDKQSSASSWTALRDGVKDVKRISSVQKFGSSLASEITELKKRFKDIVVDAGGRDSIELRAAMTVADKLIVPIQASQFDVWTLGTMNELVATVQALNPNLEAYVVLNRASSNPSVNETSDAKDLMDTFENLSLCGTTIVDRIAFRKAAQRGLSVDELPQKEGKQAADEIKKLYEEVFNA
jgi:chromosome partitioning protein